MLHFKAIMAKLPIDATVSRGSARARWLTLLLPPYAAILTHLHIKESGSAASVLKLGYLSRLN